MAKKKKDKACDKCKCPSGGKQYSEEFAEDYAMSDAKCDQIRSRSDYDDHDKAKCDNNKFF